MKQATAQKIFAHLRKHQDEMVDLLTQTAEMETPSHHPETQGQIIRLFSSCLRDIGFRSRRITGQTSGGQLLSILKGSLKDKPGSTRPSRQLLLGHCDTVWPLGTLEKMPVESNDGKLSGPGVYDMKAGLVQAIFALRSLRDLGFSPSVTPIFFINSDEEIGSADSKNRIVEIAKLVDRAFVLEPSLGKEGRLKTARKGVGRFVITVSGKAAHAGLDPGKGVSAILELSHVVQALHELNDPDSGVSVNVGTIDGGVRPNVVAAESRAEVDVRVPDSAAASRIENAILNLQPAIPGTQLAITGSVGRPPIEPTPRNQKLWSRASDMADSLGISINQASAGGGSDGNYTSLHTATLDGLGAVGDGAHALTEHVIMEKMPERAALLACLLMADSIGETD